MAEEEKEDEVNPKASSVRMSSATKRRSLRQSEESGAEPKSDGQAKKSSQSTKEEAVSSESGPLRVRKSRNRAKSEELPSDSSEEGEQNGKHEEGKKKASFKGRKERRQHSRDAKDEGREEDEDASADENVPLKSTSSSAQLPPLQGSSTSPALQGLGVLASCLAGVLPAPLYPHALSAARLRKERSRSSELVFEKARVPLQVQKELEDCVVAVKLGGVENLPEDPYILHPVVRVTLVDSTSGNVIWEEELLIRLPFKEVLKQNVMIFLELLDFGPNVSSSRGVVEDGFFCVAWGFLRCVGENNKIFVSLEKDGGQGLSLSLFNYTPTGSLVHAQARNLGLDTTVKAIPSVYLQYLRASRTQTALSVSVKVHPLFYDQQGDHLPHYRPSYSSNSLLRRRAPGDSCRVPGTLLHRIKAEDSGAFRVSFSPSGDLIAAASAGMLTFPVKIYQASSGLLKHNLTGHNGLVHDVAWSKDGAHLLSASADGTARLWFLGLQNSTDTNPGSQERETSLPTRSSPGLVQLLQHSPPTFVYSVQFHPSLATVAVTGAYDKIIRVWDCRISTSPTASSLLSLLYFQSSGTLLSKLGSPADCHLSRVNCLRFDQRSSLLYSGDGQGIIKIWQASESDPTSFSNIKTVVSSELRGKGITHLTFHPSRGQMVIQAQSSSLKVMDLHSFHISSHQFFGVKCEETIVRHCLSADGKMLLSGSESGCISLFSFRTGEKIVEGLAKIEYGLPICDVAWSPSEHLVALAAFGKDCPLLIYASEDKQDFSLANETVPAGGDSEITRKTKEEALTQKRGKLKELLEQRKSTSSSALPSPSTPVNEGNSL